MKKCSKCKENKNIHTDFYRNKRQTDGYNSWCKICAKNYTKEYHLKNKQILNTYLIEYRKNNPDKIKEHNLKRYGLSLLEFKEILAIQDNRCNICNDLFTEENIPCVDHCHKLKIVRGLLCKWCNRALGLLRDNPNLCRNAADYLEIHKNLLTFKKDRGSLYLKGNTSESEKESNNQG